MGGIFDIYLAEVLDKVRDLNYAVIEMCTSNVIEQKTMLKIKKEISYNIIENSTKSPRGCSHPLRVLRHVAK